MCDHSVLHTQLSAMDDRIDLLRKQLALHVKDSKDPIDKITEVDIKMKIIFGELFGNGQSGMADRVVRIETLMERMVGEYNIKLAGNWTILAAALSSLIVGVIAIVLHFI